MTKFKNLTEEEKKKYNLSFSEAMEQLFDRKGFVVGNMFQNGVFLLTDDFSDSVMIREKTKDGYKDIGPLTITRTTLRQQYKIIPAATDKLLGLED